MKGVRGVAWLLVFLVSSAACACGNAGNEGGEVATGGAPALGTGGTEATAAGGSDLGGTTATGGVDVASGGTTATGGADRPTGGAIETGGTGVGTGGTMATGGTDVTTGGVDVGTGGMGATGGADVPTGGAAASGGSDATGGTIATGGVGSTGGGSSTGGTTGASNACSTTATVGLSVGDLIPDVELQHCDGSPVNLHDLVCGNVLTQVYSYAGWCPGCRAFSGLEGDMGFTGNSLYESYQDDGYEQVIILSATASFGSPTTEDCAALQALHDGLVVFDATGSKTTDVLGLKINGGTGLVDEQGLWVVAPPEEDAEDGGMSGVFSELMSRFGFGG